MRTLIKNFSQDVGLYNDHLSRRRFGLRCAGTLLLSASWFCSFPVLAADSFTLKGTLYERVGQTYNIDPALLYAVTCVESAVDSERRKGFIRPYPWTLRSAGQPFYGKSRADAEAELQRLLRKGRASVDIGLAQVNSRWHGHRVDDVRDLLDPETNLKVAAQILNEHFQRFPADAYRAIGAYHSLDRVKGQRYARHVVRVYSSIKQNNKE